jgi:hypothetical protein
MLQGLVRWFAYSRRKTARAIRGHVGATRLVDELWAQWDLSSVGSGRRSRLSSRLRE